MRSMIKIIFLPALLTFCYLLSNAHVASAQNTVTTVSLQTTGK